MTSQDIVRRTWREVEPSLNEQGYELVEVELGKQGANHVLRLFIDRPGEGDITLGDCQAASQLVDPLLDARDFIEGSYVLEVSSPGIDRPIRKPEDFTRFVGEAVRVVTQSAIAGRKRFRGAIQGFHDGMIALDCEGTVYEIHIENVKRANLDR